MRIAPDPRRRRRDRDRDRDPGEVRGSRVKLVLRITVTLAIIGLILGVLLANPPASIIVVEGQSDNVTSQAPYYANNSSNESDTQTWMSGRENATLGNVLHHATRVTTFVVGDDPDGELATSGPLLMGVIIVGGLLGMTVGAGVGVVGGGVLTIAAIWAIVAVDVAPAWLYPVALFGIAIVLAAAVKRAIQ